MRKTILFGLAAAMLVTACSEEDDLRQGIAGEGITFTSSVMSRATDTSFEAGDAIGVSMYTESGFVGNATNVQYTTEDKSGLFTSTNPMTWGAAGSAKTVDFKGVYPYKADAVADGKYSFTLATGKGASLSGNDVMYSSMTGVGVGAKNVELKFKHKLVKVVMQVYDQNRKLLPGAKVKINNQQTSGTLNLADGTVTSTGDANATLDFASNREVSGEYQTIVMPSAATQGRVITITYKNVDYPCPVDMYAFDSGSKMIFSVTLNPESGTASQGTTVNATATVENWTEQRIESGWIFGEGESFKVEGKISYQLLSEPAELTIEGSHFGDFREQLNATDVYSLKYTRTDAANDATITISGKNYTLQKGLRAGTLLIAAGSNTAGIDVSSKDAGITLTSVLVYTNENIGLPITLWTGDGSAGNGTVGDDVDSYPVIARITLSEEQQNLFVPGAILRCYLADGNDAAVLRLGTLQLYYSWRNLGIFDDVSNCLTNVLTLAMCDEVKDDGNIMIFGQNWSNIQLDRVELVPASDDEDFTDLLWCHKAEGGADCGMSYGDILVNIPTSLKSGDIIRVTYTDAEEGAYLEGVAGNVDLVTTPDAPRMLQRTEVSVGGSSVDFDINEETCTALLGLECRSLLINGENLNVHKIQLVRGLGE